MKLFTVIAEFWRNGILQPIGEVIGMTEAEAKYLIHALEEKAEAEIAAVEDLFQSKKSPKEAQPVAGAKADGK